MTACPSTAPATRPPRVAGPNAKPIGRNRAFISRPATSAATALPPAVSTLRAANWAPPAKTSTDIATAATDPITGSARTPKEAPSASVGRTSGRPARTPSR